MSDLTEWRVLPEGGEYGEAWWVLRHVPCKWESNQQSQDDVRTVANMLTWIGNHVCPTPGPRTALARPLTWGQVPARWYVQTPAGEWVEVSASRRESSNHQRVTLVVNQAPRTLRTWSRDPAGPVTACPGPPSATDDAIEALSFPEVLDDPC